jgi:hypothetical protein
VVFWRLHTLYLSADKSYQCLLLSVVWCGVTSVPANHVSCILLGTLRTTMTCASFFVVQFNGFVSHKLV